MGWVSRLKYHIAGSEFFILRIFMESFSAWRGPHRSVDNLMGFLMARLLRQRSNCNDYVVLPLRMQQLSWTTAPCPVVVSSNLCDFPCVSELVACLYCFACIFLAQPLQ